jgi:hypothetical protein
MLKGSRISLKYKEIITFEAKRKIFSAPRLPLADFESGRPAPGPPPKKIGAGSNVYIY